MIKLYFWVEHKMGMNNIEIKKMNRNSIFRYMLNAKEVSKREIAMDMRLSTPTVTQILQGLVKAGLVEETGSMASEGGRKALGFRGIPEARCAVGVDITFSHVNVVVIDLAGNILYSKRYSIRIHNDKDSYDFLEKIVAEAIEESKMDPSRVLGVGISLPAIIQPDGREICGMHEGMDIGFSLYQLMAERLPYPVFLQNDAKSAARAEFRTGGTGETIIYYFISQTVGGAIVSFDGHIHIGEHMRAGEFGHMTLYPDGKPCYCGRKGCVDSYCSTSILGEVSGGHLEDFFERLAAGDASCEKVWDTYLDNLALSLHNLLTIFDHTVVIGGYLGQFIDPYIDELSRRVARYDPYLAGETFLRAAKMKYEVAAVGAAAYFIEDFVSKI